MPTASSDPLFDPAQDRTTGAAALAALAHPLRLRMLGLLRTYGPSTATRLATRVGESSGLTSHHLRQLARGGFITDAEPADLRGLEPSGGRERWWKATTRSTYTEPLAPDDEEDAAVTTDYLRAVLSLYADRARAWLTVAHTWPQRWRGVGTMSDVTLRLTVAEGDRLQEDINAVLARYRRHDPAEPTDTTGDAVVFSAQYQLFPHPDQTPPT